MIAHHLRLYCPRYIPHVLKACRPNFFTQHGVICASVVKRGSSGTVKIFDNTSTTLRLPKPERVDAVQYAEAICHSLAQTFPERYHFLSSVAEKLERSNDSTDFLPDKSSREIRHRGNRYVEEFQNMLQTCQPDEIENKCLEMFDDLPDKAKLSIACSLYANELSSSRFNKKTVRHLSPHIPDLTSEELVSLLLVIYMQKDWDEDELYEILDPSMLQEKLEELIRTMRLTSAEICAVSHGLRKIDGFMVTDSDFRQTLYDRMIRISDVTAANKVPASSADNMALAHMINLLQRGNMFEHDEIEILDDVQTAFVDAVPYLDLRASLRVMTFGLRRNFHHSKLTESILNRIRKEKNLSTLSLTELKEFAKFLAFVDLDKTVKHEEKDELLEMVLSEVKSILDSDEGCSVYDAGHILQIWSYVGRNNKFDKKYLEEIFKHLNELENPGVLTPNELINECCGAVYKALFPVSSKSSSLTVPGHLSISKNIVRIVASLNYSLEILDPKFYQFCCMKPEVAIALVNVNKSEIAIEAHATNLPSSRITPRQVKLRSTHLQMCKILRGDFYVSVTNVLPHFQEPDIVMGHIGGVPLSVDEYLFETPSGIKKPPPYGEWYVFTADSRHVVGNRYITSRLELYFDGPRTERVPAGKISDPPRARLLRQLGYNVVQIPDYIMKENYKKWVDAQVIKILTGIEQEPDHKRAPVH